MNERIDIGNVRGLKGEKGEKGDKGSTPTYEELRYKKRNDEFVVLITDSAISQSPYCLDVGKNLCTNQGYLITDNATLDYYDSGVSGSENTDWYLYTGSSSCKQVLSSGTLISNPNSQRYAIFTKMHGSESTYYYWNAPFCVEVDIVSHSGGRARLQIYSQTGTGGANKTEFLGCTSVGHWRYIYDGTTLISEKNGEVVGVYKKNLPDARIGFIAYQDDSLKYKNLKIYNPISEELGVAYDIVEYGYYYEPLYVDSSGRFTNSKGELLDENYDIQYVETDLINDVSKALYNDSDGFSKLVTNIYPYITETLLSADPNDEKYVNFFRELEGDVKYYICEDNPKTSIYYAQGEVVNTCRYVDENGTIVVNTQGNAVFVPLEKNAIYLYNPSGYTDNDIMHYDIYICTKTNTVPKKLVSAGDFIVNYNVIDDLTITEEETNTGDKDVYINLLTRGNYGQFYDMDDVDTLFANNVINKLGANNGIAQLNANGKVPASQLPSFVDDVVEGTMNNDITEFTPDDEYIGSVREKRRLYVDRIAKKIYRWNGTEYVLLSSPISVNDGSLEAYSSASGQSLENKIGNGNLSTTSTNIIGAINEHESDLQTFSTHTHGNLQNDGSVGNDANANKNVVTNSEGKITTEDKYTHPPNHATSIIKESSGLSTLGTSQNSTQHDINLAINTKLSDIIVGDVDLSGTHTHPSYQITDVDTVPTSNSTQLITSGGVYSALNDTSLRKMHYYGTCSTGQSTQIKIVNTNNSFEFFEGVILTVKFTNPQHYNATTDNPLKIRINGDTEHIKDVVGANSLYELRYSWGANEVVDFVYDGTKFILAEKEVADTTYYGVTKLTDSVSSTSTTTSATPNSVKTAYDLANGKADAVHTHSVSQITDFHPNHYYGTCSTGRSTQIKIVNTDNNFQFEEGVILTVKFINDQYYNSNIDNPLKIRINNDTEHIKDVIGTNSSYDLRFSWSAGEVVDFVYDGTNFVLSKSLVLFSRTLNNGVKIGELQIDSNPKIDIYCEENTDTTYTAGDGLNLTDTEFSVDFGTTASKAAEGNHNHDSDYLNLTDISYEDGLLDINEQITDLYKTVFSTNLSSENIKIDNELVLTITIKDFNNQVIEGKSVTVTVDKGYFKTNEEQTYTSTTDEYGQISVRYVASEWGLVTFTANDVNYQCLVGGFKGTKVYEEGNTRVIFSVNELTKQCVCKVSCDLQDLPENTFPLTKNTIINLITFDGSMIDSDYRPTSRVSSFSYREDILFTFGRSGDDWTITAVSYTNNSWITSPFDLAFYWSYLN